ncbi:MAG: hypothetical protein AAGJ40_23740 [Planctomycetota bacterium]
MNGLASWLGECHLRGLTPVLRLGRRVRVAQPLFMQILSDYEIATTDPSKQLQIEWIGLPTRPWSTAWWHYRRLIALSAFCNARVSQVIVPSRPSPNAITIGFTSFTNSLPDWTDARLVRSAG